MLGQTVWHIKLGPCLRPWCPISKRWFRSWLCCFWPSSLLIYMGKQYWVSQMLSPLPLTWMEFQDPDFCLAHIQMLHHLGMEKCILSNSNSTFEIHKNKFKKIVWRQWVRTYTMFSVDGIRQERVPSLIATAGQLSVKEWLLQVPLFLSI